MSVATIGRWGKNLAIRFPNEIAGQLHLHEGDRLEIEAEAGRIVIRPAKPEYSLDTMFAGKSPAEWRSLYAESFDWGPDLGREIVEE